MGNGNSDDVDVDVSDLQGGGGGRTFTQAEVDRIAADARAAGRRGAQKEQALDAKIENAVAKAFEKFGAMQPPAPAPRPPAAAPSTSQPSAVTPVTTGGLVDIYNLSPEQFAAMTPSQLREHHERNVKAANERMGAPPVPGAKPGGKR